MTPSEELEHLVNKQKRVLKTEVTRLFSNLQRQAPVDTGAFRQSWELEQTTEYSWRISNNLEYASILWDGRRNVGGKWQGSSQWAEGGQPELDRFNLRVYKALK